MKKIPIERKKSFYGLNCILLLKKRYIEVLIPNTSEYDMFGNESTGAIRKCKVTENSIGLYTSMSNVLIGRLPYED